MEIVYLTVALFLLLALVSGLWRILQGPTEADRMLAGQLFTTTSIACLLLLAQAFKLPSLRDVALVLALLTSVAAIAFVRRLWLRKE